MRRGLVPRAVGALGAAFGAVALAGVAVVALVGDSTAPTYLIGLLALWWLGPAVPLLLVCLLTRRPVAAALLLGPAVAAVWLVVPHAPLTAWTARAAAADGAPVLRVATWNVTAGTGGAGVLALAAQEVPDVVVLQEVTAQTRAQLAPLAERFPYTSSTPDAWAPRWGESAGAGVWSRYPIVEVQPVEGLPPAARPTQVVVLDVDGRRVAVVSAHLASPCVACRFHPSDPGPAGSGAQAARVRTAEVERLVEVVAELRARGDAVVLAGDVNASDLNEPARRFAGAGLVDAYRAVAWGPGSTRVQDGVRISRIDVVQVSGALPLRAWTGREGSSDHVPVLAELVLPPLL